MQYKRGESVADFVVVVVFRHSCLCSLSTQGLCCTSANKTRWERKYIKFEFIKEKKL